jgi:hypothetical protein
MGASLREADYKVVAIMFFGEREVVCLPSPPAPSSRGGALV